VIRQGDASPKGRHSPEIAAVPGRLSGCVVYGLYAGVVPVLPGSRADARPGCQEPCHCFDPLRDLAPPLWIEAISGRPRLAARGLLHRKRRGREPWLADPPRVTLPV